MHHSYGLRTSDEEQPLSYELNLRQLPQPLKRVIKADC
jgi:hypothetical protein